MCNTPPRGFTFRFNGFLMISSSIPSARSTSICPRAATASAAAVLLSPSPRQSPSTSPGPSTHARCSAGLPPAARSALACPLTFVLFSAYPCTAPCVCTHITPVRAIRSARQPFDPVCICPTHTAMRHGQQAACTGHEYRFFLPQFL